MDFSLELSLRHTASFGDHKVTDPMCSFALDKSDACDKGQTLHVCIPGFQPGFHSSGCCWQRTGGFT